MRGLLPILLLACFFAAGCSGRMLSDDGGARPSRDQPGSDGGSIDERDPTADAGPSDAGEDSPGPPRGVVMISEQRWPSSARVAAFANFRDTSEPCDQPVIAGPCRLTSQLSSECGDDWGQDAGSVSISGTKLGEIDLERTGGPDYVLYRYINEETGSAFDPGATIGFHATGATIPAFSGSVEAPRVLIGLSPDPRDEAVVLDRTRPAVLTWDAGDGDHVGVDVNGGDPFQQVYCTTEDDGRFELPEQVAQLFAPGTTVQLQILRVRFERLRLQEGFVTLQAVTHVYGNAVVR